jgi:hypothetical protein
MFLDIKWPGIQGKQITEYEKTIFWKNPLEKLAQWERNEYGEEDGDGDIRDFRKLNMVSENKCNNDVHLMVMTVLKAGMIAEQSNPRNHLQQDL